MDADRRLSDNEVERIYYDGYRILTAIKQSQDSGNPTYAMKLSEDLELRYYVVIEQIKLLERYHLVTKAEGIKGRAKILGLAPLGGRVQGLLALNRGKVPEDIRADLEALLFSSGYGNDLQLRVKDLVARIDENRDDLEIVSSAIDNLSHIIGKELRSGSKQIYENPELRELLVGAPIMELAGNQQQRLLALLADMIRNTYTYTTWLNEEPRLVDNLKRLIRKNDDLSVAALDVLKELLTSRGHVSKEAFVAFASFLRVWMDDESRNSIVVATNAPMEVMDYWRNRFVEDQKHVLKRMAKQIKADQDGNPYRLEKTDGEERKVPLNDSFVREFKKRVAIMINR